MASEVDIVNLALSRLGSSVTVSAIDPPDGSAYAAHAAKMYPLSRNSIIEMKAWPFATKRATLNVLSDVEAPLPYAYAYSVPSDCTMPIDLRNVSASDDDPPGKMMWEVRSNGQRVIYSDTEDAVLRYKFIQTDTTKFPPLFVDALAWMLAANMVGVVLGGDVKQFDRCYGAALRMLGFSSFSAANSINAPVEHTPSWIEER